jgi:hypothetical protein
MRLKVLGCNTCLLANRDGQYGDWCQHPNAAKELKIEEYTDGGFGHKEGMPDACPLKLEALELEA